MKTTLKLALAAISAPALLLADVSPEAPLGLTLVREAAAIIGAPALSDEAVDRVRAAAAQVLLESPAFRRFVASLSRPR